MPVSFNILFRATAMSIADLTKPALSTKKAEPRLPPLENGDHLDQKTFHERYEAMPEDTRAELIGGVVFMLDRRRVDDGSHCVFSIVWLNGYAQATPGTEFHLGTLILGEESEPQPDGMLIVCPAKGGGVRVNDEDYLEGTPELVVEIATSTESADFHIKKDDYEKAGVQEYLVVALRQSRVFWFALRSGKHEPFAPGSDGIFRSEVFPGLWLDPEAMLAGNWDRLSEILRQGLASPAHAAWVKELGTR
jgi:Uma2 family endonuclease